MNTKISGLGRSTRGPLRVLLVDDHQPTLSAIAAILDNEYPFIEVVGTARDREKAIRLSRQTAPDVVVLDLQLGASHGFDLMSAIRVSGTAVVIFSTSDNQAERTKAFAMGASAFVSKLGPVQELVNAILASPLMVRH